MSPRLVAPCAALLLVSCFGESSSGPPAGNHAPEVQAGPDRRASVGAPVVLEAAATDPDGDPVSIRWQLTISPSGVYPNLGALEGPQTLFVPPAEGVYCVTAVAFDGELWSIPDLVIVTVGSNPPVTHLVADAGPDREVSVGKVVTLDGSNSADPSGQLPGFAWTFISVPAGSAATLTNPLTSTPSFRPDVPGEYGVSLTVTGSGGATATDGVKVVAKNLRPTVEPGGPRTVYLGSPVALQANATDPDGDAVTLTWALAQRPATSAAVLSSTTAAEVTFTPDVPGFYVVSVVAADSGGSGDLATVTIQAYSALVPLSHRVADAAWSRGLDRLVVVDVSPNTLRLVDPETGAGASVILPLQPKAVSVRPDGLQAAVAHDGWISIVELDPPALAKTLPVPGVLREVVLAANGYVYAFTNAYDGSVRAVNVASGAVTNGTSWRNAAHAELHPSGDVIFGADDNVSPEDLIRYTFAGATIAGVDSPYHGDYPMCGNLWLSEDGARIFTACGNVFRATAEMTYAGKLEGTTQVGWVDHSSEAGHVLVAPRPGWSGPADADTFVEVHEDTYLALLEKLPVSPFVLPTGTFPGHARYVFHTADGSARYAVVQADPASTLLKDFAVMRF